MDRMRLRLPEARAADRPATARAPLPGRPPAPEGWLRRAELLGHSISSVAPRRIQARFWEKSGSSYSWHDEEPDLQVYELLESEAHQPAPPLTEAADEGGFPVYRRLQSGGEPTAAASGAGEPGVLGRFGRLLSQFSSLVASRAVVALDRANAGLDWLVQLQARIPFLAAQQLRAALTARQINLLSVSDSQLIEAMGQVAQLIVGTLDRVEVPDLEVERGGVEISLSGLELSGIRWNYSLLPLSTLSVQVAQVRARRVAIALPNGIRRVLTLEAERLQSFGATTLPALFLDGLLGFGLGYPGRVQQPTSLSSALSGQLAHALNVAGLQLGGLRVVDLTSGGGSPGEGAAPEAPNATLASGLFVGQTGLPSASRPLDLVQTPVQVTVHGVELGADPEDAAYRLEQLYLALDEQGSGSVIVQLTNRLGREQAALSIGVLNYRILLESIQLRAPASRLGGYFAQKVLAKLRVELEGGEAVLKFPLRKVGGFLTGVLEQAQSALTPGLVASSDTPGERQGAIDLARLVRASIPRLIEIIRSPSSNDTSSDPSTATSIAFPASKGPFQPFELIEEYGGQSASESGKGKEKEGKGKEKEGKGKEKEKKEDDEKEKEKEVDPTENLSALLEALLEGGEKETGLFDLDLPEET